MERSFKQYIHSIESSDVIGRAQYINNGNGPLLPIFYELETNNVAAVGLYAPFERTFFDIRVTHPNCDTNTFKTLDKIYKDHEKEKKDLYEERVLQSEKGSFVPLVFTTSGGMGPLCTVFVDRVSEMIADHKKEAKSQVKNHIRTRFRFDLLRSTLIALRGIRGRSTAQHLELQDISFNLIPQKTSFEVS